MANALQDVQQTFTSLDSQYNMLRAACKTDADRKALADRYGTAQANYEECVGQMLADDDAEVAALSTQLKTANQKVAKLEAEMGDINAVLCDIDQAIQIGQKILAKLP